MNRTRQTKSFTKAKKYNQNKIQGKKESWDKRKRKREVGSSLSGQWGSGLWKLVKILASRSLHMWYTDDYSKSLRTTVACGRWGTEGRRFFQRELTKHPWRKGMIRIDAHGSPILIDTKRRPWRYACPRALSRSVVGSLARIANQEMKENLGTCSLNQIAFLQGTVGDWTRSCSQVSFDENFGKKIPDAFPHR